MGWSRAHPDLHGPVCAQGHFRLAKCVAGSIDQQWITGMGYTIRPFKDLQYCISHQEHSDWSQRLSLCQCSDSKFEVFNNASDVVMHPNGSTIFVGQKSRYGGHFGGFVGWNGDADEDHLEVAGGANELWQWGSGTTAIPTIIGDANIV